jgi:hypothetical protein
MKDCSPTMKKYARYGRYLVKYFLDVAYFILFRATGDAIYQTKKLERGNIELYAQTIR